MGTISGADVLARCMRNLNDPHNVRWRVDELLDWLNDAQREIGILKPDALTTVVNHSLTPSTTLQSLPTNGLRLVDITRNLGNDGGTPGAPIRIVAREELDQYVPDWHSSTPATSVKHYTYDARSPKSFYVYPRPASAIVVEMHAQVTPTDVTVQGVNGATGSSVISLDDIYVTAMVDYVMFRALSKNTDAKNDGEAMRGYQAFLNRLGLKLQVDKTYDPNRNAPPLDTKRSQVNGDIAG